MKNARFWTVVALLAAAALLVDVRGDSDLVPAGEPLSRMPHAIAEWSGIDEEIDPGTLNVLGKGDFLSRTYIQEGQPQQVGLFIAYFPIQRAGVTIHSPKNCLPGAGWTFKSSQYTDLKDVKGNAHRVGEYVIANGDLRQFVIYWYEAHGRSVANEYLAKVYLVTDAMRMNRTDGALVRVITQIGPTEGISPARARAETFAAQMTPLLSRFIPE